MSPNPHPIHAIIRCTVWVGLVIQQYQQRKELHQELNDLQQKLNDNPKKSWREHKDLLQELDDQFGKFDKTFCEPDEPEITLFPSPHHDPIPLYSNPHLSAFWLRNAPNICALSNAEGPSRNTIGVTACIHRCRIRRGLKAIRGDDL
jgi:hypothetical protein